MQVGVGYHCAGHVLWSIAGITGPMARLVMFALFKPKKKWRLTVRSDHLNYLRGPQDSDATWLPDVAPTDLFARTCLSSSTIYQTTHRGAGTTTVPHHFSNLPVSPRVDARASDERTGIGGWYPTLDKDGQIDVWASAWFPLEIVKES